MNTAARQFVALDAGEQLTLMAAFDGRAEPVDDLDAGWPVRARLLQLEVSARPATESSADGDVLAMLRRRMPSPGGCLLVSLGFTPLERACAAAARANLDGVMVPACSLALWSEGVMVANAIREYARPVPSPAGVDLDLLRDLFVDIMEEAAEQVQALELDQDDSLLDRYVDVRCRGERDVITVPAESLTDVERLLRPFNAARDQRRLCVASASHAEVCAVRARCIISSLYPTARHASIPGRESTPAPAGWIERVLPRGHRLLRRTVPA